MSETVERQSAKIFEFPKRGRFAAGARDDARAVNATTSRFVKTAVGGAWYHDAAIADEREH